MKQEPFTIRAYGKSELAMLYFPGDGKETAMKKMRSWLRLNPRLRDMKPRQAHFYTPRQVKAIVRELGEPFETE